MPFFNKKFFISFLVIFALLVSFVLGILIGASQVECKVCPPEEIDFSLFWEALNTLEEKFADKEKIDYQKIIYGAISGMVESLGDPYTVFLNPEETKKFQEEVKGIFEGVGMEIGIKKGELTVISPLEGTPAQRAGIRPGDKILKINDTLTLDLTIDEAVRLIRGPKGTEVILTIFRQDWEKPKEIKIIREVIKIPTLKWELKEDNIAYLKLYHFYETASGDFEKASWEISKSPAKKIILDLRNNSGGFLNVAQDIAGEFLKRGEIVVIEDFGKGKEEKYYARGKARLLNYPIVVLINQGTASAAEILAGALRDNRQIKLIGERSFGKGSIQEMAELSGGSSLKITIAKWLTPKRNLITDVGLEPDIKIEMTEKDYEEDRDPQLDKAIEIIKEL